MTTNNYTLIVIGGGSAGLTAARFAAQLGVRVALVEKRRIGGDCTWTGCVPSKALLKAAKIAHATRTAHEYGLDLGDTPPNVDMRQVRRYIQQAVEQIYQRETPEILTQEGIEVLIGATRFENEHTLRVGGQRLTAKKFIIATGAHPITPNIPGLADVPYLTYLQLFENNHLPERLIIVGAGPIGVEIAQAYRRLGSHVILVDVTLLPKEEPEVAQVMGQIFVREGIEFVEGWVSAAKQEGQESVLTVNRQSYRADKVLIAVGRTAALNGLALDKAGVKTSAGGIEVDQNLRTQASHIYAAGDCIAGNDQFTHLAGWQGFQAARNALLPFNSKGFTKVMPWTTFTDPEVAHVGLSEREALEKFGDSVQVTRWNLDQIDRAVAENDTDGLIKVVHRNNGKILGATIVAGRAGEMINEYALAMNHNLSLIDLANVIHVYPSYGMGTMRLAAAAATRQILDGFSGNLIKKLAG